MSKSCYLFFPVYSKSFVSLSTYCDIIGLLLGYYWVIIGLFGTPQDNLSIIIGFFYARYFARCALVSANVLWDGGVCVMVDKLTD